MSGTSLDGLDIALCKMSGYGMDTKLELLAFETIPYESEIKFLLEEICFKQSVSLKKLTNLNVKLAKNHASSVNEFLSRQKMDATQIDILASHGQTVYHVASNDDKNGQAASLQIVDGDVLARATNVLTISDFRMRHIAYGGEGAPLAPYGDLLLFADKERDTLLINIGGISNFTLVPPTDSKEQKQIIFSDLGPGNTLMNQWAKKHFEVDYDAAGEIASSGKINQKLLRYLLEDPFYKLSFPKTTGPEYFKLENLDHLVLNELPKVDVMATFNMVTASILSKEINKLAGPSTIYISGGGVLNKQLIKNINLLSPNAKLNYALPHGITHESKESVIFAMLANEVFSNDHSIYEENGLLQVTMGKISIP